MALLLLPAPAVKHHTKKVDDAKQPEKHQNTTLTQAPSRTLREPYHFGEAQVALAQASFAFEWGHWRPLGGTLHGTMDQEGLVYRRLSLRVRCAPAKAPSENSLF